MTNLFRYFIGLIFISFSFSPSKAQVSPSDSLALAELYHLTNGNNWNNHQHWLTGNVSAWYGITVQAGRVTEIALPNNNLTGQLPTSFCDLTALKYLYLSYNNFEGDIPTCFEQLILLNTIDLRNNRFTGAVPAGITGFTMLADLLISHNKFEQLPNLTPLSEFSNLLVQNNKFTFEDLIPNKNILNFQYIPQDSINEKHDTLVNLKDTITLQVLIPGSDHLFQWYKNGIPLSDDLHYQGTTTAAMSIYKLILSDSGHYTCHVTNPHLADLILIRKPISLRIHDNRLLQEIHFIPGNSFHCGDLPLKIEAYSNASLLLLHQPVNGPATFQNDTLIPHTPGTFILTFYNEGNDDYRPVQKDTVIIVLPSTAPSPEISQVLPTQLNDPLELSVPYLNDHQYSWILPRQDTILHNVYALENVQEEDAGTYTILVSQNSCLYYSQTLTINFALSVPVTVYELITPDGNGQNDFFYIQNIEQYPDNEVRIFNAWNQMMYSSKGYTNDWTGKELPGGTYYYVVSIPALGKLLKGPVYIKK